MKENISTFYVASSDKIRSDLFNEVAEKIAQSLADVRIIQDQRYNKEVRNGITSTQLRRLFDEVKRYERLIEEGNKDSWEKQKPFIKMIKSKVHYTVARSKKNSKNADAPYYDNLSSFISEGIDLINSEKDYHVFVSLFETVYGFYYENRPDIKN